MSALVSCARIFQSYRFDSNRGFKDLEPGCKPCLGCICNLHKDGRLLCVTYADKTKNQGYCVYCDSQNAKCGGIPRELWGAAQFYWNFTVALYSRNPATSTNPASALAPIACGRIVRALDECGTAWNALAKYLENPIANVDKTNVALYNLQEQQSHREIMTALALYKANIIQDPIDFENRIEAAQPPYTRDDTKAQALERALVRLKTAETTAVRGEKARTGLRADFSAALAAEILNSQGEQSPLVAVKYAGIAPIGRGSKRKAGDDQDDDDDDGGGNGDGVGTGGSGANTPSTPAARATPKRQQLASRGRGVGGRGRGVGGRGGSGPSGRGGSNSGTGTNTATSHIDAP